MRKMWTLFLFCWGTLALQAAVFTSTDSNFTMDLPSGWSAARKPAAGSVLSIVKDTARIDIKSLPDCNTEACLEKKIQADLTAVKSRNMQVINNSYTGEEVKRIEFTTGDPFLYISFFTPKNDFSAGYFLIDNQGYSILAKDLSYAQTDLIFSFISPKQSSQTPRKTSSKITVEMDYADARAYDIEATPEVSEEVLTVPTTATVQTAPVSAVRQAADSVKSIHHFHTLITRNMPPYIQRLGHGFDILVVLLLAYLLAQGIGLIVRFFVKPRPQDIPNNPNSPYPIKCARMYGTPSLIYRAQDNLGHVFTSLTSRWESLFLFGGLMLIILAALTMALTGILENTRLFGISAFTYNAIYSAVSLIIPLGFVIFICGVLWSQLILRQFALYDSKGHKVVYVQQRNLGVRKESYLAYFTKSKQVLVLQRKRFTLLHQWQLLDQKGTVLAHIKEDNLMRAVLRRLMGHLWGFWRASYTLTGPQDSTGYIRSDRSMFNRFTCYLDKPQALAARYALAAALIINIRDRDKWYPWF